jgi:hypothetical protein
VVFAHSSYHVHFTVQYRGGGVPFLKRFPFSFKIAFTARTALGPTQPPIQWVLEALSLGVKRPRREANHSPPSSAKVKNAWSYTSTSQYVFMAWCLVKHRDNFTFTFTREYCGNRCSSGSIVSRLRAGRPGFDYRQEIGMSLFASVQTDSAAHPPSYLIKTECKAAGS